jgi:hypothetical protein
MILAATPKDAPQAMPEIINKFISLGPFCLAAAILESANLRDGSYPLDWAQSGYTTIKELLDLSKETFYYRNIFTPSIHLCQDLQKGNLCTDMFPLVSSADTNLFGYPYFYNPHRKLGIESRDYFMRTLDRWEKATSSGVNTTFVLADYTNNAGNIFFDDARNKLKVLSESLSAKLACRHRIILVRLSLCGSTQFLHCNRIELLHQGIVQMTMPYPISYHKTQDLHDMAITIIGAELKRMLECWGAENLRYIESSMSASQSK